ncbi:MAG: hypothetical protein EA349_01365 [Halomonadaceae bacterium]|nr:MAG: hypothetical protein EA349_01365 [Halomonadaceae bacterium]
MTAGTRYSDNINKQDGTGRDDLEHRVGIRILKRSDPGQCRGSLEGNADFLTYQRNTFSDRVSASLDLVGLCEPTPWLRWNLRDTLRDVRQNRRDPDTPGNRELRNVFSTGPTLMLNLSPRDNLFLDLNYQLTRYETSSSEDSNRYTAAAGWQRQFTGRWQGGLLASHSEVDFPRRDEELTQDVVSVNFSRRDPQGRLSGSIGHTWLKSELGGIFSSTTKAVTGQLAYDRQFEAGTLARFQLRRELTDASTDIDIDIPGLELNLQETTAVQVTGVSVSVSQPLPEKTNVSLSLSYTESDYQRSERKEESYGADVGLTRVINDRMQGKLNLGYRREKFDQDDNLVEHTYRPSVGIDYRQTQNLTWDVLVGMEKRHDDGGVGRRYEERFIRAGVIWNLL